MNARIKSRKNILIMCLGIVFSLMWLIGASAIADSEDASPLSPLATPPPDAFIGRNGGTCVYNNFTTAIAAASPGDALYIDQGTHHKLIGTVAKDLTFTAASNNCQDLASSGVTIDADDISRVVTVSASTNVTFTNLLLTDGFASQGGIMWVGNNAQVVLITTELSYGTASDKGGALYLDGGSLEMNGNSIIKHSTATNAGGGVYMHGGMLSMWGNARIGTSAHGNTTNGDGGGIYMEDGTLELHGSSRICSNSATQDGGGVYASNDAYIELHDTSSIGDLTSPYGNRAYNGGGAYLTDNNTTLKLYDESYIMYNQATHYGGGIYLADDSWGLLSSATIAKNQALTQGGGVLVEGYETLFSSANGSLIQENHTTDPSVANSFGGGISIIGNHAQAIIEDTQIYSNTSSGYGGGIAINGNSTLQLNSGVDLRYNQATSQQGGALAVITGEVSIATIFAQHNQAGAGGGAIYQSGGNLTIVDSELRDNSTPFSGGCILKMGGVLTITTQIDPTWIYNNQSGSSGGAIAASGGSSTLIQATDGESVYIRGNTASGSGGGIYTANGTTLEIKGAVIIDQNTAQNNGGGLYLGDNVQARMQDASDGERVMISKNTATSGDGGGIYAENASNLGLYGVTVGALMASNTTPLGDGGGIFVATTPITLHNSIIQLNSAGGYGGGMAAVLTSTVNMSSYYYLYHAQACDPFSLSSNHYCSEFRSNQAGESGGGFYLDSSSIATVDGTAFMSNVADNAAAIYIEDSWMYLTDSLIKNNLTDSSSDSAVYVNDTSPGYPYSNLRATHNTWAGNSHDAITYAANTQMEFLNNIVWNNGGRGSFFGSVINVFCNDTQDSALPWAGNVSWDPLFISTWRGDYRLSPHSSAIDACAAFTSRDLDGISRPQGSGNDMGAFEASWNWVMFMPVVMR